MRDKILQLLQDSSQQDPTGSSYEQRIIMDSDFCDLSTIIESLIKRYPTNIDIDKLEEKFEEAFDKNTAPTGGGYEADYTDKCGFWNDFKVSIIDFAKQYHIDQVELSKKDNKPCST